MKGKEVGWRVALLYVLIVGSPKADEVISGSSVEGEKNLGNVTDAFEKSLSTVDSSWNEQMFENRNKRARGRKPVFPLKICTRSKNKRSKECPFCVNDPKLMRKFLNLSKEHVEESGGFIHGPYRCPYHYELGDEECNKGETTRQVRLVKISQKGRPAFYDTQITCPTRFRLFHKIRRPEDASKSMHQCRPTHKIEYKHFHLGNITTDGIAAGSYCPDFCYAVFTPKEIVRIEKFSEIEWILTNRCTREEDIRNTSLREECLNLPSDGNTILLLGKNDFCFKKVFTTIDTRLNVVYANGSEKVKIRSSRRCGKNEDCDIGYCVVRKGQETSCGHDEKSPESTILNPKCLLLNGNVSHSLRMSEHVWCCMDPEGCRMPVGRCDGIEDCNQAYCVRGENSSQTKCPEKFQGEWEWEQCLSLEYGQTKWIEERRSWCCVPKMDAGCDSRVRSCGSDISCVSSYCIGEKREGKVQTSCPTNRSDSKCQQLMKGQELILSPNTVCCKENICLFNGTTCGENPNCEKDFCVAVKRGGASTTACPTEAEEIWLNSRCSGISSDESIMVVKGKVWCCKMNQCATDNASVAATTVVTRRRTKECRIRKKRRRRKMKDVAVNGESQTDEDQNPGPTSLEMILFALIIANVVTCFSCTVAVVCGRVVKFERKRARDLVRGSEAATSETSGKIDEFLEKLMHGKEASKKQKESTEGSPVSMASESPEKYFSLREFSEEPTTFEEDKVNGSPMSEKVHSPTATGESEHTEFENFLI